MEPLCFILRSRGGDAGGWILSGPSAENSEPVKMRAETLEQIPQHRNAYGGFFVLSLLEWKRKRSEC